MVSCVMFCVSKNASRKNDHHRGANHSMKISYTFGGNPIVLSEYSRESFCFRGNLVRYLQEETVLRSSKHSNLHAEPI